MMLLFKPQWIRLQMKADWAVLRRDITASGFRCRDIGEASGQLVSAPCSAVWSLFHLLLYSLPSCMSFWKVRCINMYHIDCFINTTRVQWVVYITVHCRAWLMYRLLYRYRDIGVSNTAKGFTNVFVTFQGIRISGNVVFCLMELMLESCVLFLDLNSNNYAVIST